MEPDRLAIVRDGAVAIALGVIHEPAVERRNALIVLRDSTHCGHDQRDDRCKPNRIAHVQLPMLMRPALTRPIELTFEDRLSVALVAGDNPIHRGHFSRGDSAGPNIGKIAAVAQARGVQQCSAPAHAVGLRTGINPFRLQESSSLYRRGTSDRFAIIVAVAGLAAAPRRTVAFATAT